MNEIPLLQNAEPQLKLLRARTRTYAIANRLLWVQLCANVAFPIVGSFAAALWTGTKAYVAAFALAVLIIDAFYLDPRQKTLIRRGAKLGEQFDCVVLELPWDQFTVGDRVEAEDIHLADKRYSRRGGTELRDWYPLAVGQVPLHLARIICQRTNLRYDSRLRRSYGRWLLTAVLVILVSLVAVSLEQNSTTTAWVLSMAPTIPFLAWAAREYHRQIDTADQLDSLVKEARGFWNRALEGDFTANQCQRRSREFQSAIYNRRSTGPLVLPLLYRFRRSELEQEMNEGATSLLDEYKKTLTPA